MKGSYQIRVENARVQFKLKLARRKGAGLFLPESFEWLILKSSLNSAYLGDRESHAIEKELGQTGITPTDANAAAKDH